MKKAILLSTFLIILFSFLVIAQEEHDFSKARQLIDSGVGCGNLTNEQLETIGDYYMEQMHPGEAHEVMDKMMGGEGSESLKQIHINIARRVYCNENNYGMMGRGMMSSYYYQIPRSNVYYNNFLVFLFMILIIITLILFILWLIKQLQKGNRKR